MKFENAMFDFHGAPVAEGPDLAYDPCRPPLSPSHIINYDALVCSPVPPTIQWGGCSKSSSDH
jgi:hypothetical protein